MEFTNKTYKIEDAYDAADDDVIENDDDLGEENDGASGCSPLNLCRSEWRTFRAEKPS